MSNEQMFELEMTTILGFYESLSHKELIVTLQVWDVDKCYWSESDTQERLARLVNQYLFINAA